MKIVADANVPRPIIISLRQVGCEVTFILEMAPRMPDPDILKLAAQDHSFAILYPDHIEMEQLPGEKS